MSREQSKGAESVYGVDSQLPLSRRFLYNLFLQVHEGRTLVGKQSPQIDHRELVKASNGQVSLAQIVPGFKLNISKEYDFLFTVNYMFPSLKSHHQPKEYDFWHLKERLHKVI